MNPAVWRGHLDRLLSNISKRRPRHRPSLPWRELPQFMMLLAERNASAARALEFTILTGCRTREVLGARWHEMDINARQFTVPPERMKAGKQHVVPLSDAALGVVAVMADCRRNEFVFPGETSAGSLSSHSMTALLQRLGRTDITVHGMRSTLADWAVDNGFDIELANLCLAHTIGNAVSRAYVRTTRLDDRCQLLAAYAAFATGRAEEEKVVAFRKS
ncbi:MAG: tyrosine-type recombinase/integrase [Hyphomicrobiaceae bacterium]